MFTVTYIKENNKIYRITTHREEIDLEALKQEVTDLKAMAEPSNEELVEHGRMMHPYYTDRGGMIDSLETTIIEVEKDILTVKEVTK